MEATAAALRDGQTLERDFRVLAADGSTRWMRATGRRVPADGTLPVRLIGVVRDVTDELAATASIREQAMILQNVEDAIVVTDLAGVVTYANGTAIRLLGWEPGSVIGRAFDDFDSRDTGRTDGSPADGDGTDSERALVRPDGRTVFVDRRTRPLQDGQSQVTGTLTVMTDITERKARDLQLQRLSIAVEQSADAIVMTDTAGTIEYVNPAFVAATGYRSDEVVGRNPRILKSGTQSDAFYHAMWAALTAGQSWIADLVNRRKDGTLFEEEAVISPVRGADGTITGYLAVKRNVTRERALEAAASRMGRERALISDTLAAMRTNASPEATAQLICQQVASLSGIAGAVLLRFGDDGRAHAIGAALASGGPIEPRIIPHQRSRYLREAATRGPWIEAWVNRPWHPYNKVMAKLGVTSTAYAPIEHDGVLFGLLTVASSEVARPLTESLPAIAEFAGLAGAMIGPRLVTAEAQQLARAEMTAIIRERAFRPVFQPIVDLVSGRSIGFEALTRFDDGVAPDERFAAAESLGSGLELEVATLRAALQASTMMSPKQLLNLNVSPALVLEGKALRSLLRGLPHRVVLEITEHSVIDDYEGFHRAVRAIGPGIRLAVDDAGAGFASFRHILELHPAFVKLDRSMVVGIDADPAKQALVAGMCQFARSTRSRLIAEGVETEAERDTLKRLGVRLAQGYLLGRPGVFRV